MYYLIGLPWSYLPEVFSLIFNLNVKTIPQVTELEFGLIKCDETPNSERSGYKPQIT